jgi:hypothetical protein
VLDFLEPVVTALLERATVAYRSTPRRPSGTYRTRDEWIIAAIDKYWGPAFDDLDIVIPRTPLISVGYAPGQRAGGGVRGTCFIREISGGVNTVFVVPEMADDLVQQLATIGHELIHVADNCQSGHARNGFFGDVAHELGFTSPLTNSANRTAELEEILRRLADDLGPFAGRKFELSAGRTLQLRPSGHAGQQFTPGNEPSAGRERNRWRRLDCRNEWCPISVQSMGADCYKARMTRAWAAEAGTPLCPSCCKHLKLEIKPEDLLANWPEAA